MKTRLWRRLSLAGAILSVIAWAYVEATGQITSVAVVNRVSFIALVLAFYAGWRSDVPIEEEEPDD